MNKKSCEMLAEEVIKLIKKRYPERAVKVEVSEDGENGALVEMI